MLRRLGRATDKLSQVREGVTVKAGWGADGGGQDNIPFPGTGTVAVEGIRGFRVGTAKGKGSHSVVL